jgi:hypothetical protein
MIIVLLIATGANFLAVLGVMSLLTEPSPPKLLFAAAIAVAIWVALASRRQP